MFFSGRPLLTTKRKKMNRDYSIVMVISCHCGERWSTAGHPDTIDGKEISQAVRDGRKVEVISIEDYRANVSKFGCFENCTQEIIKQ